MTKFLSLVLLGAAALFGAVDINHASKEELTKVKGIGPAKAEAILEYRKGKCFESVEELDKVKGFGPKFMESHKGEFEAKPCTPAPKQ